MLPPVKVWHLVSLSLRIGVCHPNTRIYVRLLGPCFKTGRLNPLCQHPKRGRVEMSECKTEKTKQNACILPPPTPQHPVYLAQEHTLRLLSPLHCISSGL